jgi:hypothetical protein
MEEWCKLQGLVPIQDCDPRQGPLGQRSQLTVLQSVQEERFNNLKSHAYKDLG